MGFVSIPVPFIQLGNRRALSEKQLAEDPCLREFVERFKQCFEHNVVGHYYLFIEPDLGDNANG